MQTTTTAPSFSDLLKSAVTEPGTISAAYTAFHNYSLGNQLLALFSVTPAAFSQGRSRRSRAGKN
jgi:hypothetical protein